MEIKLHIPDIIIQAGSLLINAMSIIFTLGILIVFSMVIYNLYKNRQVYINKWKLKKIKKNELPDNVLKFERPKKNNRRAS